jgi:hypothetical protein
MVYKSPSKILCDVKRMTKFICKKNMLIIEQPKYTLAVNPEIESESTNLNITKHQFLQILNEMKPEQDQTHAMRKQERAQDHAKLEQEIENLFKGENQPHQWPK